MNNYDNDAINYLESGGSTLYCKDCPFSSVELCNNQCMEVHDNNNDYLKRLFNIQD